MNEMFDCEGKKLYEGELIKIIGRPDIENQWNWTVFDVIVCRNFTDFILKDCVTNEIKIVAKENVKRSY
jgi:hypothetical protein